MLKAIKRAIGESGFELTKGKIFETGMGLYFAHDTYSEKRKEGHGAVSSMASAGMDFALNYAVGWKAYLGIGLATAAPSAAINGYDWYTQRKRELGREMYSQAFSNAQFDDNEQIHTMRQAGLAMAQRSKYNTQQAMMGNEAKYMLK